MGLIELVAAGCILASAILAWMQKTSNFVFSGVGSLLYVLIFFMLGQPANALINLIFVAVSAVGVFYWTTDQSKVERLFQNSYKDAEEVLLLIFASVIILGILYTAGWTNLMDYITSTFYLASTWLLIYRKIECWVLFIITDLIYLPYLWFLEMYWTLALFLILTFNAIYGYTKWKKLINEA